MHPAAVPNLYMRIENAVSLCGWEMVTQFWFVVVNPAVGCDHSNEMFGAAGRSAEGIAAPLQMAGASPVTLKNLFVMVAAQSLWGYCCGRHCSHSP